MSSTEKQIHPCIPTLHHGVGILTDFSDMAAYLLRFFIAYPGHVNSLQTQSEIVGLRGLVQQFEQDPDGLCTSVENILGRLFDRYTMGRWGVISVKCEAVPIEHARSIEDTHMYDIEITLTGALAEVGETTQPFSLVGMLHITPDHEFTIDFKGIKDDR